MLKTVRELGEERYWAALYAVVVVGRAENYSCVGSSCVGVGMGKYLRLGCLKEEGHHLKVGFDCLT